MRKHVVKTINNDAVSYIYILIYVTYILIHMPRTVFLKWVHIG